MVKENDIANFKENLTANTHLYYLIYVNELSLEAIGYYSIGDRMSHAIHTNANAHWAFHYGIRIKT